MLKMSKDPPRPQRRVSKPKPEGELRIEARMDRQARQGLAQGGHPARVHGPQAGET